MRIAAAVVAALALCAGLCAGMPYTTQQQQQQATTPGAFIGEGINNIAAALLQDPEAPGNAAYSPLGYSAILAALAEGASGKTRSQMLAALKLPQDSSLTRATYRLVLSRMKEKNALSKPEFRSWFYVYAKSTKIEDPYLAVLKEHYLMEVRDIQEAEKDTPTEFFINKEEAAPAAPATPAAAPAAPAAPDTPAAPAAAPAEEVKEPVDAPMAEAEAVAKPSEDLQPPMPVRDQVMAEAAPAAEAAAVPELPKLDEIVPLKEELKPAEDAGKAEVLEAAPLEEAAPAPAQVAEAAADTGVHQEDTAKVGEAATSQGEEEGLNLESEAQPAEVELAEKISLAKYKDEKKPTGDKKKGDKKGREESEDVNGRQPSSGPALLTSFNALYYKGEWQEPFDAKFKDDFYVAEGVQKEVTTLRTQGSFRIGDIKELNATAVELPYKGENGRYSLLVLLPRARDGLAKLTENLSKYSFRYLAKNLREKQVDVAIPEFELDCITHPQAVFRKLGMTAMLDKEAADFPGISKKRVYLQDDAMAQLVRFKVDDKNAVANYLTAMSMSTRSGLNVFHANHPFVFYLRDNLDNLTIVVGKVVDPTVRPDTSALDEAQAQTEVQLPPEPQEAQEALEEQARL